MTNREIDALVAEKVMGLKIVSRDHPCGYDSECGGYGATHHVLPDNHKVSYFEELYPKLDTVFLPENGLYPPNSEGYCHVEPVPHYTESISDAWMVVEKFHWFALTKHTYLSGFEYEVSFPPRPVEPSQAETAPLAICLAALKAVGVEVE